MDHATAVPRSSRVFMQLIQETVRTGARLPYSSLEPSEIEWLATVWIRLFDELSRYPVALYRGLVLANRESSLGKLALVFNTQLYTAAAATDSAMLRKTLEDPPFPEGESNPYLSDTTRKSIEKTLRGEMQTLNLLVETESRRSGPIPTQLINSCKHEDCHRDVCISPLVGAKLVDTELISWPRYVIHVPDRPGSATVVGCFNLLDLLHLLITDEPNPYTNKPFTLATRKQLEEKFAVQLAMFIHGHELLR